MADSIPTDHDVQQTKDAVQSAVDQQQVPTSSSTLSSQVPGEVNSSGETACSPETALATHNESNVEANEDSKHAGARTTGKETSAETTENSSNVGNVSGIVDSILEGDLPEPIDTETSIQLLQEMMKKFELEPGFPKDIDLPEPKHVLKDLTPSSVAEYIKSENCKNIIVLCGAGISTAAGIPDFRTPGTGLYDNLQKYNLPSPHSIFDLNYFLEHPEPFFSLAKELWPGTLKPTVSHYFIRLLQDKLKLLRVYTQNIDNLERIAGIGGDYLVEAHGTFSEAHCTSCEKRYSQEWIKERVDRDETPICDDEDCIDERMPEEKGLVKPDIVFFGEHLPKRFFECRSKDFDECNLLIVMGTSLKVQPFASLVAIVPRETPRLLINREKCGETDGLMTVLGLDRGLNFDSEKAYRDVAMLGDCDDQCFQLCDLLGWREELETLMEDDLARIDRGEPAPEAPKRETEEEGEEQSSRMPRPRFTLRDFKL